MVIWNVLEDLRRRENAEARLRRGEDAAALRHRRSGAPRATGRSSARTCSCARDEERDFGLKPMNCPGHMLLFGSSAAQLPRAAAAATPRRRPAPQRARRRRCTASCACGTSRRTTRTSSARAEQIEDEIFALPRLRRLPLRPVRPRRRASSSRRGPTTSSAPTRSGTSPRRRSRAALERHGHRVRRSSEGEGAFYGPKIDLHMTDVARPLAGRSARSSSTRRCPQRFGLTYHGRRQRRAHAVRDPPRAARLARALHRHPDRALRRRPSRSGSRPCRCACSRSARRTAPAREALADELRAAGVRVEVDERDETVGRRIRDAELEKIPYVVVYGDRESPTRAGRPRARRRAVDDVGWTSCSRSSVRC